MSGEEMQRRVRETGRKLEIATGWLSATVQERLKDGASGRVVVEIITREGYIHKLRVTAEENFDDEG